MLRKQPIDIAFARGLQQKVDPWRLEAGSFESLINSVFQKEGLLQKRNGYERLAALPDTTYSHLTTLNDNLTALGSTQLSSYNDGTKKWTTQGSILPMSVSTLPVVRNSLNQTQCDAVISSNGLLCTVYTETGAGTTSYKYTIVDSTTGQNVLTPRAIPVASGAVSGAPRVFLLSNFFVIVFTNTISGTAHLQYVVIPTMNPTAISSNLDVASAYIPSTTLSWDGVVANNNLYLAYNTTSGGQAVKVTYLSAPAAASAFTGAPISTASPTTFAGAIATMVTLCADLTAINPLVYVSYWEAGAGGKTAAVFLGLSVAFAPQSLSTSGTLLNMASAAQNGSCKVFYEVSNNYTYDASIPTHFIKTVSVTSAGVVGATTFSIRSLGLASKAFINNGVIYYLAAFQSTYQPTYFLINGSSSTSANPAIVGKLAYENGGGYLTTGIPGVCESSAGIFEVAYLFKDLIAASNTASQNNSQQTATTPVYSQTGINLATFDLTNLDINLVETAGSLQFSGGFSWMYDGIAPVEQNFFLWPDSVEVSISTASLTPTGTTTSGSFVLTAMSSTAGVGIGMAISGTGVAVSSTVVSFTSTTITMSKAATGTNVGTTITLTGNIASKPDGSINTNAYYVQAVYEWTDNKGLIHRSAPSIPVAITTAGAVSTYIFTYHVPTLRLTYKISSPVKITVYRWSVANQEYFQSTSIVFPSLNDPTVDYIDIVDALADASIIGNDHIYTTGGVVENINPPAANIITMFDDRVWLVDAEDQNLWWYSKQVIEGTPVEMSDLLTYYVAPATAAQGPTGPITAGAPMDDKLISFKKNAIYYTNGVGPDNTGNNNQYSQPIFITSTVGCTNQQSIVFTDVGLMFQSDKGIWLLGRDLVTQYIGAPVEDYNSDTVLSAICVPDTNYVLFTLDSGVTLMYDYFFKQWGTFKGAPAISSTIYQGLHTYISAEGVAFQETPGLYLDDSNPVLMSFTTAWLKLAGLQGYQRAYFFYLLGEYLSPHFLQLGLAYDYNSGIVQAPLIRPANYSPPAGEGTSQSPAGQQTTAGGPEQVEQWRVFLKRQRCQSIQLSLNEFFDPSQGAAPGAGLTLSGLMLVAGIKNVFRPMNANRSVG